MKNLNLEHSGQTILDATSFGIKILYFSTMLVFIFFIFSLYKTGIFSKESIFLFIGTTINIGLIVVCTILEAILASLLSNKE